MLSRLRYRLAVFFAILGPGFITAVVDNDAGGIITYSQAGARAGYPPRLTLPPVPEGPYIYQVNGSREGSVPGKTASYVDGEEMEVSSTRRDLGSLLVVY